MINNNCDNAVVVDSSPESTNITTTTSYGRNPVGKGPVEVEIMYINNLPCDVVVVDRTGFRHKVPKVLWGLKGNFIIRFLYTISESAYDECKHLFAGFRGTPSNDLEIIRKAMLNNMSSFTQRTMIIGIDHTVSIEDFQSVGGSLYLRDADTVVSSLSLENAPSHPYAKGSVSESHYNETIGHKRIGFSLGLGIEMVNRAPGAQCMFTYIMQSVKKIPVSQDVTRDEGFYITTLDKDFCTTNELKLETLFFKLEDAKKLGIYRSEEETKTNGDIRLLWESQIAELKHNAELLKLKLSENKMVYDDQVARQLNDHNLRMAASAEEVKSAVSAANALEREHQVKIMQLKESAVESSRRHEEFLKNFATIDQERDRAHKERMQMLEKEREYLRDEYDKKSYKRKDFSDTLKIILATLTTMGAIILTYNKTLGKETK